MHTIRVGVLMGGRSIEREVSLNSGRTMCDHLDTSRYDIVPLFLDTHGVLYLLPWRFLHRGKISDFEHRLKTQATAISWDDLHTHIDIVYIAMHGRYSEDGSMQGLFEVLNIPYFGSNIYTSALCMDKIMLKDVLSMHEIDVPRGIHLTPHESMHAPHDAIMQKIADVHISFPLVIKPYKEGSSLGIAIISHEDELRDAIKHACTINPHQQQSVIIEEHLSGMEFTCIVLHDYKTNTRYALQPTEIIPEEGRLFFDYEQKYMPGRAWKFTPPKHYQHLITRLQEVCVQTAEILGITDIARIDGFVTPDERIVIVDPNTFCGLAPSSFVFRQAAEAHMSHTHLINHLIETTLTRYGMLEKLIAQEKKQELRMHQTKTRIAVFMGGRSNEKEISLESGRNISYKLSPHLYDVTPVFVDQQLKLHKLTQSLLVRNSTKEIEDALDQTTPLAWNDLATMFDFVFLGLHGGEGENGTIQGALEALNIPYNGSSVLTSSLCMDKYKTSSFLQARGFDVPRAYICTKTEWISSREQIITTIKESLGLPCIIKPHDDGCSVFVHKADNETELAHAIDNLFAQSKPCALIEEFVRGMELTVGVIGNDQPHALPPSQAIAAKGILSIEEKFLPGAGENQTPAPLPAHAIKLVQQTMEQVYTAVGCKGYARIDCFYQTAAQSPTGKERVITLEINTLPGMTPATCIFHQAAEIGIKPMDFVHMIVQLGLEEHKRITLPETIQSFFIEK